ncbi:MAG: N-acetyltransferase [Candidatus Nealsonbacteria bacterium CG_4_10_14_0_2_um_filter_38_17]|uniref:N-acetyltransferase n=2 Tax=Candidatus Nealsoniibacteriota TaxID=1817911 RepID=A0A2M7UXU5_9BACT|nr:MAG: N-acetyltransferase [Candidatus Nealsonbacteria bacterium CG23_combo_of_CG06-09_8_20_14_all_38_19]PIZ88770.1 MAG: N-acetyltransferase [Candidatus Nealsonbacteria bacterium CG_4_10_14_0_2_um_filter_38_17]
MKTGKNTIVYHPEKSVILDCQIGDNCKIHAPVWIGKNVKIGEGTRVEPFCFIPEEVEIGKDCFIGPGVMFTNDKYPPAPKKDWKKTIVRNRVTIGAGAVILPGITIEEGAFIAAGAVVTRSIPKGELWAGVPAKKRKRKRVKQYGKKHLNYYSSL